MLGSLKKGKETQQLSAGGASPLEATGAEFECWFFHIPEQMDTADLGSQGRNRACLPVPSASNLQPAPADVSHWGSAECLYPLTISEHLLHESCRANLALGYHVNSII